MRGYVGVLPIRRRSRIMQMHRGYSNCPRFPRDEIRERLVCRIALARVSRRPSIIAPPPPPPGNIRKKRGGGGERERANDREHGSVARLGYKWSKKKKKKKKKRKKKRKKKARLLVDNSTCQPCLSSGRAAAGHV